jgi:hypothetical protein
MPPHLKRMRLGQSVREGVSHSSRKTAQGSSLAKNLDYFAPMTGHYSGRQLVLALAPKF